MSRSPRQVFYVAALILASAMVLGAASPTGPGDEPSSYVYDVVVEADRETVGIGESFTATVYLCNPSDRDVLLEPIRRFTFSGDSLFDPEPVSSVVYADYPGGAKIRIGAHDKAEFVRQVFTPEYPGPFRVTCLGATKNVIVTGYKEVALNSTGISLVIEPSRTDLKDRDYVKFNLVIKNDNPYPVKIPVFNKLYISHTPERFTGPAFIDWFWTHIEMEAESQRVVWRDGYFVRYPHFSLYYHVEGVTASLEMEVGKR